MKSTAAPEKGGPRVNRDIRAVQVQLIDGEGQNKGVVNLADALAAFAPGGLEAMTMMAFALGLDPLFVGAHHIARFLFISLALPWVARRVA